MSTFKDFLTEEAQMLMELEGYHKYEGMDFYEILEKIKETNGHKWGAGALGVVFIPKDKNYVYKCWVQDGGYEKFLDIVEKNQSNPFFPKLLSKRRKLETFFKRPAGFDEDINLIKMEKLTPLNESESIEKLMELVKQVQYVEADELTLEWLKKQIEGQNEKHVLGRLKRDIGKSIDDHAKGKSSHQAFNNRYKKAMERMRDFILNEKRMKKYVEPAYEAMKLLSNAKIDDDKLRFDMHSGNFMMRSGKELVITDPFVTKGWDAEVLMQNLKADHLGKEAATTGRKKTSSSSK